MEADETVPYAVHAGVNSDSVVAITGAGGVIGSGIARRFAATGASLLLHFRSNERAVVQLAEDPPVATVLVQ